MISVYFQAWITSFDRVFSLYSEFAVELWDRVKKFRPFPMSFAFCLFFNISEFLVMVSPRMCWCTMNPCRRTEPAFYFFEFKMINTQFWRRLRGYVDHIMSQIEWLTLRNTKFWRPLRGYVDHIMSQIEWLALRNTKFWRPLCGYVDHIMSRIEWLTLYTYWWNLLVTSIFSIIDINKKIPAPWMLVEYGIEIHGFALLRSINSGWTKWTTHYHLVWSNTKFSQTSCDCWSGEEYIIQGCFCVSGAF